MGCIDRVGVVKGQGWGIGLQFADEVAGGRKDAPRQARVVNASRAEACTAPRQNERSGRPAPVFCGSSPAARARTERPTEKQYKKPAHLGWTLWVQDQFTTVSPRAGTCGTVGGRGRGRRRGGAGERGLGGATAKGLSSQRGGYRQEPASLCPAAAWSTPGNPGQPRAAQPRQAASRGPRRPRPRGPRRRRPNPIQTTARVARPQSQSPAAAVAAPSATVQSAATRRNRKLAWCGDLAAPSSSGTRKPQASTPAMLAGSSSVITRPNLGAAGERGPGHGSGRRRGGGGRSERARCCRAHPHGRRRREAPPAKPADVPPPAHVCRAGD